LRFEALTRVWGRFADWLDKRGRFRDQVRYWERNGRNRAALIEGQLLSDALAYHDLSGTEQEYLQRSQRQEYRQKRAWRTWFVIVLVLLVVAIFGWGVAGWMYHKEKAAKEEAINAKNAEIEARIRETKAKEEAVEANTELAELNLSRLKKDVLANLTSLVQSHARMTYATDEAEHASAENWFTYRRDQLGRDPRDSLIQQLKGAVDTADKLEVAEPSDRQLADDVHNLYEAFKKVEPQKVWGGDARKRAGATLQFAGTVREKMENIGDSVILKELAERRKVSYRYDQDRTDHIV